MEVISTIILLLILLKLFSKNVTDEPMLYPAYSKQQMIEAKIRGDWNNWKLSDEYTELLKSLYKRKENNSDSQKILLNEREYKIILDHTINKERINFWQKMYWHQINVNVAILTGKNKIEDFYFDNDGIQELDEPTFDLNRAVDLANKWIKEESLEYKENKKSL